MIEGDHEENKVCVYVTDSVSLEAALGEGLPRRFTDKYGFAAGATQGREQLAWLEEELSLDHTHECRWMVVTGHRPVFSGADREVFPAERPFQAKMHRVWQGAGRPFPTSLAGRVASSFLQDAVPASWIACAAPWPGRPAPPAPAGAGRSRGAWRRSSSRHVASASARGQRGSGPAGGGAERTAGGRSGILRVCVFP